MLIFVVEEISKLTIESTFACSEGVKWIVRFLRLAGTLPTYGVHFFFHLREMFPLCSNNERINVVLHHGKEYMNKKSHMQNLETLMLQLHLG